MRVEDSFVVRGHLVLGGPLLVPSPDTIPQIASLFGSSVTLTFPDGRRVISQVAEVTASQPMAGGTQVLLGIQIPTELQTIPVGSLVFAG